MLDRRTINVLLTTLVFLVAVALVYVARTILVLFAFSSLFSYLINPAVRVLQRYSPFFKDLKGPHIFKAYPGFLILLGSLVHAFAPDFHSQPGALVGQLPAFADSVASGEIASSFGKNLGWSDARTVRFKTFLQGHRSDIESAKQNVQRSGQASSMACALREKDFRTEKEDRMPNESTSFSTIRTPSSYPASQKGHLSGARADVRVPYREIALSATRHGERVEENLPLPVYDTSGQVMEWGFDGVLVNTAVSRSLDPIRMARAFANAVSAGRNAFLAGPMIEQQVAAPSTPEIGRPFAVPPLGMIRTLAFRATNRRIRRIERTLKRR